MEIESDYSSFEDSAEPQSIAIDRTIALEIVWQKKRLLVMEALLSLGRSYREGREKPGCQSEAVK